MIVVPNTIEQAINAARVEQLNAGLYLDSSRLTSVKLRQAVESLLTKSSTTFGLGQIRRSFEEAGGVQRAADAIHALKESRGLA